MLFVNPSFCFSNLSPIIPCMFLTHRKIDPGILYPVPLRTCSPDWLGRRKGARHIKNTFKGAASRSSFPLSYMFDAAVVTVQIIKYHSLIPIFPRQFVLRFFFPGSLCVSLLLWQKLLVSPPPRGLHSSHLRTFAHFRFFNFFCFPLSHFTFLLGQVLFLGFGKYLTTTEKSLRISDP